MYVFIVKDYVLKVSSIPRSSKTECAIGSKYRGRFGVCTCNEHCSWDLCRLVEPPKDCLLATGSVWQWDNLKNAYVAQVDMGMILGFITFNQDASISTFRLFDWD